MWRNKLDKQFWIFTGHQCGCAQCTATGGQEILGNHADSDRFIVRRTPRYALTVMVFDCLTVRSVDRKHDNPKDMQDFHLDSRSVQETFGILVLQISSNSLLSVSLWCGWFWDWWGIWSFVFLEILQLSVILYVQNSLDILTLPGSRGPRKRCPTGRVQAWHPSIPMLWGWWEDCLGTRTCDFLIFFSLKCFIKTMVIHQWGHHLIFIFHECPCCRQFIFRQSPRMAHHGWIFPLKHPNFVGFFSGSTSCFSMRCAKWIVFLNFSSEPCWSGAMGGGWWVVVVRKGLESLCPGFVRELS